MKVLVTGCSGFVGPYLARELLDHNHSIVLTSPFEYTFTHKNIDYHADVCDLSNEAETQDLIKTQAPDAIINLAGYSHVGKSWNDRETVLKANVHVPLNLLEAADKLIKPVKFIQISSSHIFKTSDGKLFLNENSETLPDSPYAASKLASENIVHAYNRSQISYIIFRSFNHIGPGQHEDFVCPSLARRIIATEDGGEINVGNLDAKRDFSDVRDIVAAYRLAVEYNGSRHLFTLGSGKAIAINEVLAHFIEISGKKITTKVDPELLRASDIACLLADSSLAKSELGWQPKFDIVDTLKDIYEFEKSRL